MQLSKNFDENNGREIWRDQEMNTLSIFWKTRTYKNVVPVFISVYFWCHLSKKKKGGSYA